MPGRRRFRDPPDLRNPRTKKLLLRLDLVGDSAGILQPPPSVPPLRRETQEEGLGNLLEGRDSNL